MNKPSQIPPGAALPERTWRLMDTPPAPGAWNMALDEALAASVRAGAAPVLRVYRWAPACLSLGRNQPARGRYDVRAIHARGWDIVRRPTGGRAVLHDRELTYSVAVQDGVLGSPREAYAAINRALVAGLRLLGVPAHLQPQTGRRAPAPSLSPCFQEPVEGEVVAAGRKLVGSAQRRDRGVILQHGSLLLENDQREVRSLLVSESPPRSFSSDASTPDRPSAGTTDAIGAASNGKAVSVEGAASAASLVATIDAASVSAGSVDSADSADRRSVVRATTDGRGRIGAAEAAGGTESIDRHALTAAAEEAAEDEAPATLAGLLGRVPEWDELVRALAAGWQTATGITLVPAEPTESEVEAAREAAERYRSAAWTWHL